MKRIHNILEHLHKSFTSDKGGYSARKLTSFGFFALAVFIHGKYLNQNNAFDFLCVDVAMILLLLGIVTIQNLIEFKNGKTDTTKSGTID